VRATLTTTLVFLVLGAAFGFLGGVFGIGGGIIAIPILGIFFGLSEQLAQGTAIIMVAPNALVGLWRYLTAVKIDWRIVVAILIPALPVTVVASHVATVLPSRDLRFGFAVFTVLLAAYMFWRAATLGAGAARRPVAWQWATVVGLFSGVLSGLFTIGGAIFAVPILSGAFGLSQLAAQATSLAFVTPGLLISLAVFVGAGDVDWSIGIPLAIGGVVAVPLGVNVARRLPDRALRFAFVGFLLVCAVGLFLRAHAA
jgi:uncharacterized membrane protein YfcA